MRRSVPLAALCGLAIAVVPAVGSASAASTGAVRPPAVVRSADAGCTLSPSLDYSGGDQASCIAVGAKLSKVPSVGATATLTVTVKAARAETDTRVTIDLPPTLAFADGTPTFAAVNGAGRVARANAAAMALTAGANRSFTRIVRAVGSGFGAITVSAKNRLSAIRTDGGTTSVFLTTGTTANASFLGQAPSTKPLTVARHNYASAGPETTVANRRAVSASALAHPIRQAAMRPNTAGTSCATGTWNYVDQNGSSRPAFNTLVEVLNPSNTLLSYAVSAGDGSYNVCWSTGGVTSSIYVKFVESNNAWSVVDESGNTYSFSTGVTSVPDGTSHSFGNLYPGTSSYYPGLHAFDEANDEYQWIYQSSGTSGAGCWSPFQTTCQHLVIHWAADSTTGTFWNSTGAYLLAGSPDTLDEPVHEYGHALMYNLYDQNFPATTNCNPHYLFTASSTTCGFTEGWADWVATSVYNNMVWTFNGGSTASFDVTWNEGLGYNTGDQVEGRIVQALRSLTDGVKAPWDNDPGEGSGIRDASRFFTALADYRPNTLADFWADRAALGQDTTQTALSALYQGTIDYGFRNPLADYVGVHFPEAVPDHNYGFTTTTGFWSVVAVRPDVGSDVDLTVYNDFNQTAALASSAYGGTTTDFVAINSNSGARALQTYYPRVHQFSGSGGYTIQSAQGSNALSSGESTVSMLSTQPVRVWDSFQSVGVPVFYRAVPTVGSQDLQLLAPLAGGTVVSRSSTTSGADPGAGNPATLTYTPTTTGWAGLVLLNNAMTAGTVNVYADTSAPTGTVSINGGAATATKQTVKLALTASDPQTGVLAMQVSTDGVFDTEPVVDFSATSKVKLPSGNGTKTVYVRYENNAGMWSAPVSDTIALHVAPTVTKLKPNSGPKAGGTTVTITGSFFRNASAVKFGTKNATSFHVVSDTKITAVAPKGTVGAVDVRVTNPYGTSPTSAKTKYTYQ